jgi:hypothetical protein
MNTCPVCGFPGLDAPPWVDGSPSDEICPSCGIQFGYDDAAGGRADRRAAIYERWRSEWIARGMPWSSGGRPRPPGWDPQAQLDLVVQSHGEKPADRNA